AARCGAPTVPTLQLPYGVHIRRAMDLVVARLGPGPYILKPRSLGMGYAVARAENEQDLRAIGDLAAQPAFDFLDQARLPIKGHLRVHPLGGEIIAALLRQPKDGGYLANIHQGGHAAVFDPPGEIAALSKRIARELDAEFLALDWFMTS